MMQKKLKIAIFIVLLIGLTMIIMPQRLDYPVSYWLWAGITSRDAPPDSELYIYQGIIYNYDKRTTYKRIGLYPHPIKSKKLYLTYRLEGDLPDVSTVMSVFHSNIAQWKRHKVNITGLQLDFDSPTSKLIIYSNFLKEVREQLPKHYALSITGLGDWAIYGDKKVMRSIAIESDEIVFQLYQGWHPLPNIERYIKTLGAYPLPFRIGLLYRHQNQDYIEYLRKNANFNGVIYFIQKDR